MQSTGFVISHLRSVTFLVVHRKRNIKTSGKHPHGAAHQQPQDFFVLSTPPALRDTTKKGIRINFVSRKEIQTSLLQSFKTETGYVQVSSPELTAADLITYQKEFGG